MQFRDLKKQYDALKKKIDQGIQEVINSTSFISGKQVETLESQLAEYVGVKHCITCGNGTDALTMALMAWEIGPGDCVFVPDFTFFASGETVALQGAVPVFVDVDKSTFNIQPVKLEEAICRIIRERELKPRAIVTVDLFGLPADYDEIRAIADKYGLYILEDSAQGFGGQIQGKRACSFGDISTTSFFPAKPLGCYGDGGAIFTDDDKADDYLRSIRVHGKGTDKYDNIRIGLNSRLDTIQAAILLPKFKAFVEYELEAVNLIAQKYTELLKDMVVTPHIPEGFYSSWAQYCIQLESENARNSLQSYLKKCDIPTMIYYPKPMHEQGAFIRVAHYSDDLANSVELCKTVLELPMSPYLTDTEVQYVAEMIRKWRETGTVETI